MAAAANLPPAGPVVTTLNHARSLDQVGHDWIIVAVRLNGRGEWAPTLPPEEWRTFRAMVDDGAATTTQRRDPGGTVLLAKLRRE